MSASVSCCDEARAGGIGVLVMPDGRHVCWRSGHATDDDLRFVRDLDQRGRALKIPRTKLNQRDSRIHWMDQLVWPYGPNIDAGSRLALVEWAESEGVAYARTQRHCVEWLMTGRCTRYSARSSHPFYGDVHGNEGDSGWRDHLTSWVWAGTNDPAVLVSQPYGLFERGRARLSELELKHRLRVQIESEGWYAQGGLRLGTVFVGLWRDLPTVDREG